MKIILNDATVLMRKTNLYDNLELNKQQFLKALENKKHAQTYDKKGIKHVTIQDGKVKRSGKPTRLRFERLNGPFILVLFSTTDKLEDPCNYRGLIVFEENEIVKVYRDSLSQGFTDAMFCDDTTMFIQVVNKDADETRYIQLQGEPTSLESWKYEGDESLTVEQKKYVDAVMAKIKEADNLGRPIYGIVQLEES